MPIRLKSVEDERSYVFEHPHNCGGPGTGAWEITSHVSTRDFMSGYFVTCERCGVSSYFEFDPADRYPPGVVDELRRKAKQELE
jgi:hypothetical protein